MANNEEKEKFAKIAITAITLLSHTSLLALYSYQVFRAYSGALMLQAGHLG